MNEDIPTVRILNAIKPSLESVTQTQLSYPNLSSAVKLHAPYEYDRMSQFWDAPKDSLEELKTAKQLASHYMLMGLQALHQAPTQQSVEAWSEKYTQASSEMYGVPDPILAQKLEANAINFEEFREAAEKVRDFLKTEYQDVFDSLEVDRLPDQLTSKNVFDLFAKAKEVLQDSHDSDWSEWTLVFDEESNSLSVDNHAKTIIVGAKRRDMPKSELEGLIAHELLVHALCSLNGYKTSDLLGKGLPDYLDAEEGFGTFVEFGFTGQVPLKIIDRYTDIAYALGQFDGTPHTRQDTLNRALKREKLRNPHKSANEMDGQLFAHVNRIYRGSLGDDSIGVFTKDIVYYPGFVKSATYFKRMVESGQAINDVMKFRMQGCIDPENDSHIQYIEEMSGRQEEAMVR